MFIRVKFSLKVHTLLQGLDVATGEGDTDAMDGNLSLHRCLTGVLESLFMENTC